MADGRRAGVHRAWAGRSRRAEHHQQRAPPGRALAEVDAGGSVQRRVASPPAQATGQGRGAVRGCGGARCWLASAEARGQSVGARARSFLPQTQGRCTRPRPQPWHGACAETAGAARGRRWPGSAGAPGQALALSRACCRTRAACGRTDARRYTARQERPLNPLHHTIMLAPARLALRTAAPALARVQLRGLASSAARRSYEDSIPNIKVSADSKVLTQGFTGKTVRVPLACALRPAPVCSTMLTSALPLPMPTGHLPLRAGPQVRHQARRGCQSQEGWHHPPRPPCLRLRPGGRPRDQARRDRYLRASSCRYGRCPRCH